MSDEIEEKTENKKSYRGIQIYFPIEMLDEMKQLADAKRLKLASWLRMTLNDYLEQLKKSEV